MKKIPTIPLRQLLEELQPFIDKDIDKYEVSFGGLSFYRTKLRSDTLIQIEFNETVYLSDDNLVVVENHE